DFWDTQCGEGFLFMEPEELPKKFKFCPYCGGQIFTERPSSATSLRMSTTPQSNGHGSEQPRASEVAAGAPGSAARCSNCGDAATARIVERSEECDYGL